MSSTALWQRFIDMNKKAIFQLVSLEVHQEYEEYIDLVMTEMKDLEEQLKKERQLNIKLTEKLLEKSE